MEPAAERFLAFARDRDQAALEGLLAAYRPGALKRACELLADPGDAEDAVQDATLRLVATAARYDGSVGFGAWFGRLVLDACAAARRSAARERRAKLAARSSGTEQHDARADEARLLLLRRALGELPPELRAPLELRYVEGLSQRETAARLGTSETLVAVRLHRGKARLRERLARCGAAVALPLLERDLARLRAPGAMGIAPRIPRARLPAARLAWFGGLAATLLLAIGAAYRHGGTTVQPVDSRITGVAVHPPVVSEPTRRVFAWDFSSTAERLEVLSGTWHRRADGGVDDSPCMESDGGEVRVAIRLHGLRLPLRIDARIALLRAGENDYQAVVGPSQLLRQGRLENVARPQLAVRFDQASGRSDYQHVVEFIGERSLDVWTDAGRAHLNVIDGGQGDLELLLVGPLRIDDLRLAEVEPVAVPDVTSYVRAVLAIPEDQRHGTVVLPGLGGLDPALPVTVSWPEAAPR